MTQVDYLAKALSEDVREVISLDYLPVLSFTRHEYKVETALSAINQRNFVVAPLVVQVFVHRVGALVKYVD